MKKPLQSLEQSILAIPLPQPTIPNPPLPLRPINLHNLIITPTDLIHNILNILIKTLEILYIS